jgi:hypothetical protein
MAQAEWGVNYYVQHRGLRDPDSVQVRDIRVSGAPTWRSSLFTGIVVGWEVDFELNKKDAHGDYIGFRRRAIIMLDGGTRVWWNWSLDAD